MKEVRDEGIRYPERFGILDLPQKECFEKAIEYVLKKINESINEFTYSFPAPNSVGLKYPPIENIEWTNAFWTGMLWLAYEVTGDDKYRKTAEIHCQSFKNRIDEKININNHDIGFLYTLSCIASYKLTGNIEAKETALKAARHLATRYHDKAKIIQAWGKLDEPGQQGRFIVDCSMNLPLLYWASSVTGDDTYYKMAHNHIKQTANFLVREDSSTFHQYYMDTETGEPIRGLTGQGYSDDSSWARGQAWAIYGFPLSFNYTGDVELIEVGKKLSNYFLNRIPEDYVCYWDLIFTDGNEERDSSAAAITTCGLLEMAKNMPLSDPSKLLYENAALKMLENLALKYTTKDHPESNGVLGHAVYNRRSGKGVNECCIWGDYFYFEALVRVVKPHKLYW